MSEPGAGTDVKAMKTKAVYTKGWRRVVFYIMGLGLYYYYYLKSAYSSSKQLLYAPFPPSTLGTSE